MPAEGSHGDTSLVDSVDEGSDSVPEGLPSAERRTWRQKCRISGLWWKALSTSSALVVVVYLLRYRGAIPALSSSPEEPERPWQNQSFEQKAWKSIHALPYVCTNKSLTDYLRDHVPKTVVLNAFDNKYVGQAQRFARKMDHLNAAYVGFCKEPECVGMFWQGCKGCRAHILHCPSYRQHISNEPYIHKTARCRGWRDIQYIKSFAFYDVVKSGKNVFVSDLDHDMTKINFYDLMNRYKFADVLVFMRDLPSQFVNYGFFFARNSLATHSIANHLRIDVHKTWDQAIFNYQISALENMKRLHCVEMPYKRFELRRLMEKERCGLDHTHIDERRHPRCWKPPKEWR